MSHPFSLPTSSRAWHEGVPSFLCQGGELEMRLLRWEVPRLWTCQERRATREQYPPGTISATLCFWDGLNCLPGMCRNNQWERQLYKVYKHLFLKLLNAEMSDFVSVTIKFTRRPICILIHYFILDFEAQMCWERRLMVVCVEEVAGGSVCWEGGWW